MTSGDEPAVIRLEAAPDVARVRVPEEILRDSMVRLEAVGEPVSKEERDEAERELREWEERCRLVVEGDPSKARPLGIIRDGASPLVAARRHLAIVAAAAALGGLADMPMFRERGGGGPKGIPCGMPTPRKGPRVGRNEPCPCGSGKKRKRCCS